MAITILLSGATIRAAALPDWPMFTGPSGNFDQPNNGANLLSNFSKVPKLWISEAKDIPRGKLLSDMCGMLSKASTPPSGGTASLIVGGGNLFTTFFVPNDNVYHQPCLDKDTFSSETKPRLGILADDVTLAMDAKTGKTLWRAVETKKGASRPPSKREGWGVTPVYHQGKVFSTGTTGRIYAYDAKTGKKIWESDVGSNRERLQNALDAGRSAKKFLSEVEGPHWIKALLVNMVVARDVIVAPADFGGLSGLEPGTGKVLWSKGGLTNGFSTPGLISLDGKEYLVCNNGSSLKLVDPSNGNILWTQATGTFLGTVATCGNLAISNVKTTEPAPGLGLWGAYELSTSGAKAKWSLPDHSKYHHSHKLDAGALRKHLCKDDVVYVALHNVTNQRFLALRSTDGSILADTLVQNGPWGPTLTTNGSHIFLSSDQSHPGKNMQYRVFKHNPGKAPTPQGDWWPDHVTADGYEVAMVHPIVGGYAFFRTGSRTIVGYDLNVGAATGLHSQDPFSRQQRPSDIPQFNGNASSGSGWSMEWVTGRKR